MKTDDPVDVQINDRHSGNGNDGGRFLGLRPRARTPSTTRAARQNRCSRQQANPAPNSRSGETGAGRSGSRGEARGDSEVQTGGGGEAGLRRPLRNNQLRKVNVVSGADGVQIEISSTRAVTPQVTKLNSPARVLVELPETVVASAQNKIAVGSAGVKGVRIGMDGKTPPTTSVVVDLEKPLAYDLTPGPAGKIILTLHSAWMLHPASRRTALRQR